MSLNWREIDAILAEIPLAGAIVRQIFQPSHPLLILELYQRSATFRLLLCFSTPNCRLHTTNRKPANPAKLPRFVAFLRARIRDGRIVSAAQLGRQRIVRIEVLKGGESAILWARFWGGAANLIVTDRDGTVLDALYRRPKRGETSGGRFLPEAGTPAQGEAAADEHFTVRELAGEGSFNERVERYYLELEQSQDMERLRALARSRLERKENRILAALERLRRKREESGQFGELRRFGELILENLHALKPGERWLSAEDYEQPGQRIDIELDPQASPAENAELYFKRYRKAKASLRHLGEEEAVQERELASVRRAIEAVEAETDLAALRARTAALAEKKAPKERGKDEPPGLRFASGAFRLLVGRSAAENDALLRRFVRGNDTWVHARDHPGAYVFIRSIAGKSVPLETLIDAASLAIHFSKGRGSGQGDVYYTQVKYLRRARDAKAGLVLPTQEKNLHVRLEPQRLQRLLGSY